MKTELELIMNSHKVGIARFFQIESEHKILILHEICPVLRVYLQSEKIQNPELTGAQQRVMETLVTVPDSEGMLTLTHKEGKFFLVLQKDGESKTCAIYNKNTKCCHILQI